jgi:hypothetical protein
MTLPRFISVLLPGATRDSGTRAGTPQEEISEQAQQFAQLLANEIKLYNQDKIREGRKNRDLYSRLKKDIEKSRESYNKRFGSTAAAGGDYFTKEIIRILADNDVALMGSEFFQ